VTIRRKLRPAAKRGALGNNPFPRERTRSVVDLLCSCQRRKRSSEGKDLVAAEARIPIDGANSSTW
jgi:hypothetical protein